MIKTYQRSDLLFHIYISESSESTVELINYGSRYPEVCTLIRWFVFPDQAVEVSGGRVETKGSSLCCIVFSTGLTDNIGNGV